ncbi:MAG: 30S ribosomal protein S16 [Bdellovibrionales bacterium]|nr:30S ribosomal protein S16 [Bdellovibrionales bacterium]
MVKIRLSRMGAKKNPQFVIVAANESACRDGKRFEKLGFYYPKAKNAKDKIKIDLEKYESWKSKGAQVSLTVEQLVQATKA